MLRTEVFFALLLSLSQVLSPSFAYADPARARTEGYTDGSGDGAREGRDRGPEDGRREGDRKGYSEGYDRCEREEEQRHYDLGYRDGTYPGERDGRDRGEDDGERNGRSVGHADGTRDGEQRADRDASNAARPLGTQRGTEEANQSDASARGDRDGTIAGDELARRHALERDYPRGRSDYRNERFNEPIENNDEFAQQALALLEKALLTDDAPQASFEKLRAPSPDRRYWNPRRTYPTPEENSAYQSGYASGYPSGMSSAYDQSYAQAYNVAYSSGYARGCTAAKNQNYRDDYDRGYQAGYRSAYDREYRRTYDEYYSRAYSSAFSTASRDAYSREYPSRYQWHYEDARAQAYARRVNELYTAAYERAKKIKYDAVYPGYAAQEYARGRADETADFQARPVRLLAASIQETIANGVYEPGELLRARVELRNFEGALAGRDIRVTIEAVDAKLSVISQSESTLRLDLRRKSLTKVSGLLEFRMNENAVKKTTAFVIRAEYQGRNVGMQTVSIKPLFLLELTWAEAPKLREGIESVLKIKAKNNGNVAFAAGAPVLFSSKPELLEITRAEAILGALPSGGEQVLEFAAIARKSGTSIALPVVFQALAGPERRRVGLLDETRDIPLANDYRIEILTSLDNLRKPGVTRVEYRITNVGERAAPKGLQLKSIVNGESADNFSVVGPNPQYLSPIPAGKSSKFVVPLMSKDPNSGGQLELQVQEDGRTVVIHRKDF